MSQAPPTLQPTPTSFHPMDNAILSITHTPPSAVDTTGAATEILLDSGTQRKITVLQRPTQPQSSSGPSVIGGAPTLAEASISSISANPLTSEIHTKPPGSGLVSSLAPPFIPASQLPQVPQVPQVSQVSQFTRAARNDYYDTEDPSVNLHEFIVNSMQAQKNRVILMKLEEEFLSYVSDPSRAEPMKLPPWDSYHRMLAHRVAAYFGLEHNVDPMDKSCVIVCKGPNTRIPQYNFAQFLPVEDMESAEPKHILKRAPRETTTIEKFEPSLSVATGAKVKSFEEREEEYEKARARILGQQPSSQFEPSLSVATGAEVKSFEEREEEYEKARARILGQQPSSQTVTRGSLSFDFGSPPRSSSMFPMMHHRVHRRTASDTVTSLFSRPSAEFKKEGPSSSHSSRSATPLFSALTRGASQESFPPQRQQQQQQQTPQKPTHQQVQMLPQQPQQQTPPQAQPRPQAKYNRQHVTTAPSFQFQPMQGLPVLYPQAPVMADPNWYYSNMMLYQVAPQPYIPAQYAQMVQPPIFPMNQAYSVAPGVIGQVSPLSRLPMVAPAVEQIASPPQPTSATLVRPVPQQASSIRLFPKVDGTAWTQPQSYSIQQHGPAIPGSQPSGHTAFTSIPPDNTQQLTEQMKQVLSIGGRGSNVSGASYQHAGSGSGIAPQSEKQKLAPVGQKTPQQLSVIQAQDTSIHAMGGGGIGSIRSTIAANGAFHATSAYHMMAGTHGMEAMGGHMISPTQVGPIPFIPSQLHHAGTQDPQAIGSGHLPPRGLMQYPSGLPPQGQSANQPSTPPIAPLNLHHHGLIQAQQHQGIFSPTTTGVTHSPVQIMGHTLGTSLFSPPPSSTTPHGAFVNSPTSTGKIFAPGAPTHPPVGSGPRFRRFDSPKQGVHIGDMSTLPPHSQSPGPITQNHLSQESPVAQHKLFPKPATNGAGAIPGSSSTPYQALQLPPRLAQQQQQQQQRNTGTRYQNQRHPANRSGTAMKSSPGVTLADLMPSQFVPGTMGSSPPFQKREPLLPTPPSAQMVKQLDTNITCGVPLNVMEVTSFPHEGTAEQQQAFQTLRELGAQDIKVGRMSKTGEDIMIAIFNTPDGAVKALHMKHPLFTLSIPRNNHAKFIISLLQAVPTP